MKSSLFKKPKKVINLKNYDHAKHIQTKTKRCLVAPNTPTNILICGYTGSGKTNLLLNLIYDLLYWDNLYIYAKDLEEQKYQDLQTVCEKANLIEPFMYQFKNNQDEMIDLDDLDRSKQNLIVFDDFITDRGAFEKIQEYFIRGRKKNCTVIFISQSFFAVPKIIRLNCSYFCFFASRDDRDIQEIYKNHSCSMPKQDFIELYRDATQEMYNFLCIDKTVPPSDPKAIRKNFDGMKNA